MSASPWICRTGDRRRARRRIEFIFLPCPNTDCSKVHRISVAQADRARCTKCGTPYDAEVVRGCAEEIEQGINLCD